MTGHDDELDDFLARRKPLFRRVDDDPLEPPAELDRIVLRQAREAIEAERPQRVYSGPRFGTSVALAATLVLAITGILQIAGQPKPPRAEVTVENVAQRLDPSAAAAPAAPAAPAAGAHSDTADLAARTEKASASNGEVTVNLAEPMLAKRESAYAPQAEADRNVPAAPPPPPPSPGAVAARSNAQKAAEVASTAEVASSAPAPTDAPAWRRDAKTWLAHIEQLRTEGKNSEADAELAEYKREHRAYAGAPDR